MGLAEWVDFPGYVSRSALAELIGRSWVHVVCSLSEGWGLTVTEALACGVPTAAYRVPGISDVVVDGVTGRLADSGDVGGLVLAIKDLLERPSFWRANCLRQRSLWSWEDSAVAWEHVLLSAGSTGG